MSQGAEQKARETVREVWSGEVRVDDKEEQRKEQQRMNLAWQ